MERQPTIWEKVFATCAMDEEFMYKYIKSPYKSIGKEFLNRKRYKQCFTKEEKGTAPDLMEKRSVSTMREVQLDDTERPSHAQQTGDIQSHTWE